MSLIFQKYFLSIFILLFQQFNKISLKGIVETLSTTNPLIDKRPPNLYKWIEENAHICTIVPVNGESLVSFLSEEEGKKCSICPDLGINEVPTMACAVEVTPNDIENLDIGCHKLPDLCVIELKNRYAEFYMNISLDKEDLSSKPPKPLGDKSTSLDFKRSEEEKIFQATDSLFSTKSLNLFSSKEKNEIEKDEEEEQKVEFEGTHEEEIGKIFEGLKGEEGLHVVTTSIRPTTMKTASSNFKVNQLLYGQIFLLKWMDKKANKKFLNIKNPLF
uniref:Uncharacterized protein n=1 Tax=Meloidogyne enterolobii TaxID=390850 RepID=A0A6V7W1K6_MELEN|nr:unnamed protein product [Meloidogyne enterolobii]